MTVHHINFVRLHPDAVIPRYQQEGDNGMDVRAIEGGSLAPGERTLVKTGIAANLLLQQAILVFPRSGLALKHGITVANAPGLVDSSFAGQEIGVILSNTGNEVFTWEAGDRVAQFVPVVLPRFSVGEHETAEQTGRSSGFGSSGVK